MPTRSEVSESSETPITEIGSLYRTMGTERTVRCYAVSEDELDSLSHSSTNVAIAFSIAGGALGYGLGWFIEWVNKVEGSLFFMIACLVVAIPFVAFGVRGLRRRNSVAARIKSQAADRPRP